MSEVGLRPVGEDDLDVIESLYGTPDAGEYSWFGWQTPGFYRKRWAENGLLSEEAGTFMVVRGSVEVTMEGASQRALASEERTEEGTKPAESAERLGYVSWRSRRTGMTSHCWVIGICMLAEARGHGYGSRAQRLLAEYLYAHTMVNRIEAYTEFSNIGEQRALEKAGFTREGVTRGGSWRDGEWRDGVLYGIVRADLA